MECPGGAGMGNQRVELMKISNIEHPTSNIQSPRCEQSSDVGCWMLDVGCWMFPRTRRRAPLRLLRLLLTTLALCLAGWSVHGAEAKVFDVRQYGAKGDGQTLDTAAVQKALDACGQAGGGVVRVPPGTYLSRPIRIHSRTTLLLEEGATLKATDDPRDYLPPSVTWDDILAGRSKGPFTHFLSGKKLTDVTITGKGTIDGSGARWWEPAEEARRKVSGFTLPRPDLVRIAACKHLKVSGITLKNSPKFHLVPEDCEDVVIEGVTILAPAGAANTDAVDPSLCRHVTITKCMIDVGDDNVAIKSGKKLPGREFGCEDITITDCVFKHGHGVSIGSETAGGVRNVTVRHCQFEGTENGLRIKTARGKGGRVEKIVYEDITMKDVVGAITITTYYPKIPASDAAQPVTALTPQYRDIRIANLKATSVRGAGVIVGLPESRVQNVVLENVQITAATTGLTIRNASGVSLKNVRVSAKEGPPFIVKDAQVEGLAEAQKQSE
jgi:polygalacturonase